MSLFNQLGRRQAPPQQRQAPNPMQMMQELRANPASFLKKAGLDIPEGMSDPQQMVNHLMQSGQVSQSRYQQAVQMMGAMGKR